MKSKTASSVHRALALAAPRVFHLVISDISLPDGNSVDLMVQLTRDYRLRGIALSGYGWDEDFARTKRAGFLAHLVNQRWSPRPQLSSGASACVGLS